MGKNRRKNKISSKPSKIETPIYDCSLDINAYNELRLNGFEAFTIEKLPDGTEKLVKMDNIPFDKIVSHVSWSF